MNQVWTCDREGEVDGLLAFIVKFTRLLLNVLVSIICNRSDSEGRSTVAKTIIVLKLKLILLLLLNLGE